MKASECRELYEATDATGEGLRNVFVLGGFLHRSERVAIASQQVRAINLIGSLGLAKGQQICVIGGGAAGLTAAAYAIDQGVGATVLENRAALWNLRGCRTRWLHPNLFRSWPHAHWQQTATDLPVMNWYADYASEVGDLLLSKYRAFERRQAHWTYPAHRELQIVGDVRFEPAGERWRVEWDLGGSGVWRRDVFDAVVVAIGFGPEARMRDTEASVYWLDDTLEREDPHRLKVRCLISGTGDGGLTDLLRMRIEAFRHHQLRNSLLELEVMHPELREEILQVEDQARRDTHFDPTAPYMEIVKKYRFLALRDRERPRTSVTLTNNQATALVSNAWPISRFLAATLLEYDRYTTYRPGPARWTPVAAENPVEHPRAFSVQFGSDPEPETFDMIVVRHGPKRIEDPRYGATPVKAVEAFLVDRGLPAALLPRIRAKWDAIATTHEVTDTPLFTAGRNADHECRNRTFLPPPIAGRTVAGMLSRLISAFGPDRDIAVPDGGLRIDTPLVTDEAAMLLTRMCDHVDPTRQGWQLGEETERASVVELIRAADASLEHCWDDRAWIDELVRSWVIPRAPWLPPPKGRLLRWTHVARDWDRWKLLYARTPAKPRRTKLAAYLDPLAAVTQALEIDQVLAIVDVLPQQRRIAVCQSDTASARRLGGELGAKFIIVKKAYPAMRSLV